MSARLWILVLACLCVSRVASAQTGYVSGGLMVDVRRYAAAGVGPQVYDGEPIGGFVGAGLFVTHWLSVDFETGFSANATTKITTPISISGSSPVDFTTTYHTRVQTYSALGAVHLPPLGRLHLSVRGGVTWLHHRREIIPPTLQPPDPRATTPTQPVEIVDNVTEPAIGVDADVPVSSRLAIIAALRANRFTVATDLSAYSVRPMVGVRVRF